LIASRKLEFIFAEVIEKGYDAIITCGGLQSNHCRTTAVAAASLGVDCHLLLRSDTQDASFLKYTGLADKLRLLPFANSTQET
jgi:1-aminocyclopropane-1-carboxylate deaminase/D-cysteine desulfhydrase-like pyridoxal-dependent ACC family enzyme